MLFDDLMNSLSKYTSKYQMEQMNHHPNNKLLVSFELKLVISSIKSLASIFPAKCSIH